MSGTITMIQADDRDILVENDELEIYDDIYGPAEEEEEEPGIEGEDDVPQRDGDEERCGDCRGRCVRCCGNVWAQCKRDCSTDWVVITLMHIMILLCSLMVAVVSTVSKKQNSGKCYIEAIFNEESGGYSLESSTGVMCDYPLYYGLCSAALAFLFITFNWIGALHKARRWLQVQTILHIFGLLGELIAGGLQTVGFLVWCKRLIRATKCDPKDPTCTDYPNRGCYNSTLIYDDDRGEGATMHPFFKIVLTTMVGDWFTFLLWLICIVAVAYKLVQQSLKDGAEMAAAEREQDKPPAADRDPRQAVLGAAGAVNGGIPAAGALRQRAVPGAGGFPARAAAPKPRPRQNAVPGSACDHMADIAAAHHVM